MAGLIKIGMVVPFSGPAALRTMGATIHAGTAAWLARYNRSGGHCGRPVELLVEDSGYDVARMADAIRRLVEQDGVLALLNTNGTPQLTAAMPYLQAHKVPLLLPFAGADAWFHPPQWGVFGIQPPFNDVGFLLGQWAARSGHRRVTVLHPHYPEISPLMAGQAVLGFDTAKQRDGRIDCCCVQLGCEDGEAMADAVLGQDPDAVIVLVNWVELIAIAREMRRRERAVQLYSWSANVTQHIAFTEGALLEGMKGYAALMVGPTAETPVVRLYRSEMARHFPSQQPDFLSLAAFAHAMVFTGALDRISGQPSASNLVTAFETLNALATELLPPVTFTASRHIGVSEVQAMVLNDGQWRPLGPAILPLETTRYV